MKRRTEGARQGPPAGRRKARGGVPGAHLDLLAFLPLPAGVLERAGDQRVVFVNEAFRSLVGYSAEEIGTLGGWIGLAYPDPDDRAEVLRAWEEGGSQSTVVGAPHRIRARDGRSLDVRVSGAPLKGGLYIFVMRDVTTEIRAEDALRASEARFRKLMEALPDGVVAHDGGRIVFANPAAARMVGREDPQSLVGEPIMRYVHPDCRALVSRRVARILTQHEDLELIREKFLTDDGRPIDVEVAATEVEVDGRSVSMVVFRDIGERLRHEEERREAEENAQQAQKLRSLSMLAGGVAHDFNNLLAGILGNTELALMEPGLPRTARARLHSVERVARQASELASQMQAYTGGRAHEGVTLDLSLLIGDLAELLRATVPRTVDLGYDLVEHLPAVEVDPTQIRQVLLNVVANASEALAGGTGRIAVRTLSRTLTREALSRCVLGDEATPGEYVLLEVRDDGPGMDPATRARAFEPFFSTKRPGRGLGLAAVLGIVRAHEGAIEVESEKGRGTLVRVYLPARGVRPASRPRPEHAPMPEAVPHRGLVLVVDDEETVLEVATAMLETAGFGVVSAMDGPGALRAVEEHRQDLSCVLLDRNLPGMDGLDVYASIQAGAPDLPVVICSGYPRDGEVERVLGTRRIPYVGKPFRYADLVGALRDALDARNGRSD